MMCTIRVFWDVMPCSSAFRLLPACFMLLQMEAIRYLETLVDVYRTTRRSIPEDKSLLYNLSILGVSIAQETVTP
jgi:hypothetical protein